MIKKAMGFFKELRNLTLTLTAVWLTGWYLFYRSGAPHFEADSPSDLSQLTIRPKPSYYYHLWQEKKAIRRANNKTSENESKLGRKAILRPPVKRPQHFINHTQQETNILPVSLV